MIKCSPLLFFLSFILISTNVYSQNETKFTHTQKCFALFVKAYNEVLENKDTVQFNKSYIEIDSLIASEKQHNFHVKYLVFKGTTLNRIGYKKAGIRTLNEAIDYGYKHLDSLSNRIAVAYGNLGVIHQVNGNIDKFIENTLKSKEILQHNYKKYAGELIQTNFNLEVYLQSNPKERIKYQQQNDSLIHFTKESDRDIKALYYIKKGIRANHSNDLLNAKRQVSKGLSLLNNSSEIKLNLRKYYYRALATFEFLSKNYQESIKHYKNYINIIEYHNDLKANAYYYSQISECFKRINENDSALYYSKVSYLESIKENPTTTYVGKSTSLVYALDYLIMCKYVNNSYDMSVYNAISDAPDLLKETHKTLLKYAQIKSEIDQDNGFYLKQNLVKCIEQAESRVSKSYFVGELAKFEFKRQNTSVADSIFTEALNLLKVDKNNPNSLSFNYNLSKTYLQYKYQILNQNTSNFSNIEIINRYDEIINGLLGYVYENWDSYDRDERLKEIKFYCNEAINFCYERQNKDDHIPYSTYAMYFSNQSNSILLKYNHRRIIALKNSKLSKEELEKMRYYKLSLDEFFLDEQNTEKNHESIVDIQNEYNNFIHKAEKEHQALINFEGFDVFSKNLKQQNNHYSFIFTLHSNGKDIYKIVHSKQQSSIVKLDLSKNECLALQSDIFNAMSIGNSKLYSEAAYSLFQSFFPEKTKGDFNKILVLNAPELLPIPFECLIDSPSEHLPFNKLPYLVKKHEFVYSEGFSNDYTFKKNFNLSIPYLGLYSNAGKTLHSAKKEIDNGKKLLNGEAYNVNNVSKKDILNKFEKAQIIHIATHSKIDSINSYASKLIFSDTLDNNLKYHEIMNLDMNPNLLILNACSTGEGQYKIGEGKISIARAFNYAGAKNVLINSWDVPDFSVSKIIEWFLSDYNNNIEVGEALQHAKQKYIDNSDDITGNPIYWAGTIFVSSNHVQNKSYLFSLFLGITIFSLAVISAAFLIKK